MRLAAMMCESASEWLGDREVGKDALDAIVAREANLARRKGRVIRRANLRTIDGQFEVGTYCPHFEHVDGIKPSGNRRVGGVVHQCAALALDTLEQHPLAIAVNVKLVAVSRARPAERDAIRIERRAAELCDPHLDVNVGKLASRRQANESTLDVVAVRGERAVLVIRPVAGCRL